MVATFENVMRTAVSDLGTHEGIDEDSAFSVWYCEVAFGLDRLEALEASRYDGGNDKGIDVFYVDDELQRVVIAQTKYYRKSTRAPTPSELSLLLDASDALSDPQSLRDDGRPDLADAAEDLADAVARGYSVQLQMVWPGQLRKGLGQQVRTYNRIHGDADVTAELIAMAELESVYSDFLGSAGRVETGALTIVGSSYEQKGSYGRAVVATVSAQSLKALYDAHGDRLFDQNVRLFLGARKGSVNAAIRETIDNPSDRGNFWAYNNGITVVARSFKRRPRKGAIELEQFSIVNGCQTTVLIGRSGVDALTDITVLARIVAAPKKLVDSVIKYTNSQTPIKVWEMSSRDKEQQRIRRELDQLEMPWFYAFRRGEFETVPDKERYGPAAARRTVPFPQGIQYLASFRGLPVQAYKDKGRLFTAYKDKVLPPGLHAPDLLWATQLAEAVLRRLPGIKTQLAADEEARVILSRGSQFFAVAIAAQLLRERNGADFTANVDPKRLVDNALADRLDKYAVTALLFHVQVIKQMARSSRDVATILRSPETNSEIQKWVLAQMIQERLAPKALAEKLPLLPEITPPVSA